MKNLILRSTKFLLIIILVSNIIEPLKAQEESNLYFEMVKIKDLNGKAMEVYQEYMMPYMQERVKNGLQIGQAFFRVISSINPTEFDYVIVDMYESFDQLHTSREQMMGMAMKVFEGKDLESIGKQFDEAIEAVNVAAFKNVHEAFPGAAGGMQENWKFVKIDYLYVDSDLAMSMEKDHAKYMLPVARQGAKDGHVFDKILAKKLFPLGTLSGPNYLDITMYTKWKDLDAFKPFMMFPQVHPQVDMAAIGAKYDEGIEMQYDEILELVSIITPETVQSASTGQ